MEGPSYGEILEGLSLPSAYPHPAGEIELVTTVISAVFLAGDFAYKMKKPVKTAYLDYSTPERRLHFCELEVELNRRTSPDVYLGVVPVVTRSGKVIVDAPGEVIGHAVKMKRLPRDRMMNVLLENDAVTCDMVREVSRVVSGFHNGARTGPAVSAYAMPESLERMLGEDLMEVEAYVGTTLSQSGLERIGEHLRGFVSDNRAVLEDRVAGGRIRDLHGDLHCRNICIPGDVYIFDCIEFNPAFRCADVAKEIAFLAMDLDFFDRRDLSRDYVDEYVRLSKDGVIESLLGFYKTWLAVVRGKVNSIPSRGDESPSERRHSVLRARKYFGLADEYSGGGAKPWLILMMGAMGTGKSHLASALAGEFTLQVLDSDAIRKRMAGLPPDEPERVGYGESIYSPEMTERVYSKMVEMAREFLESGYSVLLDASFSRRMHRQVARRAAEECGARFLLVLCEAPPGTIKERLETREAAPGGPSDGRWELVGRQMAQMEPPAEVPPENLLTLDTDRPARELVETVVARMEQLSRPSGD